MKKQSKNNHLKSDPYMKNRVKVGRPRIENGVYIQQVTLKEKDNLKARTWGVPGMKASERRIKQARKLYEKRLSRLATA